MRNPTAEEIDGQGQQAFIECASCVDCRRNCSNMFELASAEAGRIAVNYDHSSIFQAAAYERLLRLVDAVLRDANCQLGEDDRLRNIGFPVAVIEPGVG